MNTRRLPFLFLLALAAGACNNKPEIGEFKAQLEAELAKNKGVFSLAFRNLGNGDEIFIREHVRFHAASTMKTPVMIEVFKQASEGRFSLSDSLVVKNEFSSIVDSSRYSLTAKDDSEADLYDAVGKNRSIGELTNLMITYSSNLATNMLIELVGAKNVTATMQSLGAPEIEVLRGVEDQKAFDQGMINSLTSHDLMVVMEKLAKREVVSELASGEMIEILLDQKFNDLIPAELPEDVKVAHKTGWLTGVHHDSGIVILPDGRQYVLVLLSKNLEDEPAAVRTMAHVSRMIYDYVK